MHITVYDHSMIHQRFFSISRRVNFKLNIRKTWIFSKHFHTALDKLFEHFESDTFKTPIQIQSPFICNTCYNFYKSSNAGKKSSCINIRSLHEIPFHYKRYKSEFRTFYICILLFSCIHIFPLAAFGNFSAVYQHFFQPFVWKLSC